MKIVFAGFIAMISLALCGCSYTWELNGDKSSSQKLTEPTEIQGLFCQGHVCYYENGNLETCVLAREDTLSGQPLPAGTTIHFIPEGPMEFCFLPHGTYIQGHLCRGGGHNWMTCFHPNGQLRLAWLGQDKVIRGVPCKKASFWADVFGGGAGTHFHENGNLKRCKLADDVTIEGRSFKKGGHVDFDEYGNLILEK